jgi:hypothetical protein
VQLEVYEWSHHCRGERGFNFDKFEVFKSNDFAKLYAWRFAKGMFAHHHQALTFYCFKKQKRNTHAHFVCAITKQEAPMCVCANVCFHTPWFTYVAFPKNEKAGKKKLVCAFASFRY